MSRKPLPTRFTGPFESPGFLLWRVVNAWQHELRVVLKPYELTHTQFVVLAVASWFGTEQSLTQTRLSQLTGSDPMTISQVVRTLETMGHFERAAHPTDTRAKVVVVSQKGRDLAAKALGVIEAADTTFFEVLGEDKDLFIKLLLRLIQTAYHRT